LRRCIDSILVQTLTDFECILIDDGSTDNCPTICDEYAGNDERIRVIHQENRGTAFARDAGIKNAKGEFLVFVDSDDWLEPNALELLYKKQRETDADMVMGGVMEIWPHGTKITKSYKEDNESNALVYFLLSKDKYMFGKLYRKSLFNQYTIPDTNMLEDAMVNIQIFSRICINKLQSIGAVIYNYDNRTNGITKRVMSLYNYDSYADVHQVKSLFWIENYLNCNNCRRIEFSAFSVFFLTIGIIPYLRFNKKINKKEIRCIYGKYYKNCTYKNKIEKKYKLMIVLFNLSIHCGKIYVFLLNSLGKTKRMLYRITSK
jgi:glycosyltransferase involved in cell wall biosynthesis